MAIGLKKCILYIFRYNRRRCHVFSSGNTRWCWLYKYSCWHTYKVYIYPALEQRRHSFLSLTKKTFFLGLNRKKQNRRQAESVIIQLTMVDQMTLANLAWDIKQKNYQPPNYVFKMGSVDTLLGKELALGYLSLVPYQLIQRYRDEGDISFHLQTRQARRHLKLNLFQWSYLLVRRLLCSVWVWNVKLCTRNYLSHLRCKGVSEHRYTYLIVVF